MKNYIKKSVFYWFSKMGKTVNFLQDALNQKFRKRHTLVGDIMVSNEYKLLSRIK